MKFYRAYVELTNICGLACSFCPPKALPTQTMSLPFFEHVLDELSIHTKEIAYHMGGDSLTLSNLKEYLDITHKKGFRVMLTTSGYYLGKHSFETLLHPAIKQINISLNSYNKNNMPLSFEDYMKPIAMLCEHKRTTNKELFINLRLWNLDDQHSEHAFNDTLFSWIEEHFGISVDLSSVQSTKAHNIRLAEKILLHFDRYFEWPTLSSHEKSHGTCQGLSSHIGILSNGVVVPCCLDKDGVIALGNLHETSLATILTSKRSTAIKEGFKQHLCQEELCQKCTYKHRFKEN